jgi:hypothetical protein
MGSPLPGELTDTVLMLETGWSWQQLMETPPDEVEKMRILINKRALITKERAEAAERAGKRR